MIKYVRACLVTLSSFQQSSRSRSFDLWAIGASESTAGVGLRFFLGVSVVGLYSELHGI